VSRDWQSYLGDIVEACQRARSYSTELGKGDGTNIAVRASPL
jgi:uncharacterized protein with HEPN domain